MKQENLIKIAKELIKARVPFTPLTIFKKSKLNMSYRTFLRGVIELIKTRYLYGYKISHGRGKGINWIITNKDELVERKEEFKA